MADIDQKDAVRHEGDSAGQALLKRLLEASHRIGAGLKRIAKTNALITGDNLVRTGTVSGLPVTQSRFFPALQALTAEFERHADDVERAADELAGHF